MHHTTRKKWHTCPGHILHILAGICSRGFRLSNFALSLVEGRVERVVEQEVSPHSAALDASIVAVILRLDNSVRHVLGIHAVSEKLQCSGGPRPQTQQTAARTKVMISSCQR